MKVRSLFGALAAALTLLVAVAAPASATHRVPDYQQCLNRHDFTSYFRNNSPADKYCYAGDGSNSILTVNLDRVTWFHSGVNWVKMRFRDGGNGVTYVATYPPGTDTGCTNCYIEWVQILE